MLDPYCYHVGPILALVDFPAGGCWVKSDTRPKHGSSNRNAGNALSKVELSRSDKIEDIGFLRINVAKKCHSLSYL